MTNEKKELIEIFQELFNIERTARDAYSDLLKKEELTGKKRIVIQNIYDDEVRHMEIAEGIINDLES